MANAAEKRQGGGAVCARREFRRHGAAIFAGGVLLVLSGGASGQSGSGGQPPESSPPAKQDDVKAAGVTVREAPPEIDEGPAYLVSRVLLEYASLPPGVDAPDLQDADFQNLTVTLGLTPEGYVAAGPGMETVTLRIGEITEGSGGKFYRSAIEAMCLVVVREMNRRGIYALFVAPNAEDIDERPPYKDKRDGRTALRLSVFTGVIRDVRTVASGDRNLSGEKIDNPAHAGILKRSPLQPGDLLRKDRLDDYLFRLNRHPGRRVDAAIAGVAADDPGDVELDYLVGEWKTWTAYAQVSNTGTENTSVWRERFGFSDNQLTNNDDIFRIDYSTAGFDASNALIASYDFPIKTDYLRARVFGTWSEYTASDVGQNADTFTGNSWSVAGELIGTVYQRGPLFLDLVAGVGYDHQRVVSPIGTTGDTQEGAAGFLLPALAGRVTRYTDASSLFAEAGVDFVANDPNEAEVQELGRGTNVDNQWTKLRWTVDNTFFVEPLFIGPRGTPDGKGMTLAQEVAWSFRGQYTFGSRVIPSEEAVAGGLYTVRGYPESTVAGDNMYLANIEYRFHYPNSLATREPGKFFGQDFRWAPQAPYARADWDLIFRAFFDAAWVTVNDADPATEANSTLIGTGVGVELQIYRNLDARLDWGVALNEVNVPDTFVSVGSNRLYFVLTLAY